MLSFDVSAIDVVLLVAVLALFMLFVTQKRSKTAPKHHLDINDQKELPEESKIEQKVASENHDTQSAKAFQKCVHQFGYLKDMPKNTPIPDECFGCPNVMRCLFPNSPASSENKAS
jgi:hypothetical protein